MPGREEFDYILQRIENELLKMGQLLLKYQTQVFQGFFEQKESVIQEALHFEEIIDQMEENIGQQVCSAIALHQPFGSDLRLLISVLFIASDIERIGDLLHNIGKIMLKLLPLPMLKPYIDLPRMNDACLAMMTQSLEAFQKRESQLAVQASKNDDIVDQLYQKIWKELLSYMMEDPQKIEIAEKIIALSKQIERIGDHITNIAERICFMETGTIPDLNE